MAIEIIGPDSSHFGDENIEFLGKLLATILYHEIPKSSEMMLKLSDRDLEKLQEAANKLDLLCDVIRVNL